MTARTRAKGQATPIWTPFHTPPHFLDDAAARALLESTRWPGGPKCPHCRHATAYRMQRRPTSTTPGRPGLLRCRHCGAQFTVTIGTVFEDSHLRLSTWLRALSLLAAKWQRATAILLAAETAGTVAPFKANLERKRNLLHLAETLFQSCASEAIGRFYAQARQHVSIATRLHRRLERGEPIS